MKLKAYSENLQAMLGELGGGDFIPIRVEWEDFDVDGKFTGMGSDNSTTVTYTTQTILVPYDGVNDGRVRKISEISWLNTDVSHTRRIRFYIGTRGAGILGSSPLFVVPALGMLYYNPNIGWKVYAASGTETDL